MNEEHPDLYYDREYIENILNIFSENKIKMEFEDLYDLIKTVEQVGKLSLKKESEVSFFKSKRLILLEFNVEKKEILSTGIAYPCTTINYCPYPQVREQLNLIYEAFKFHPRHIVDLFGIYGVMYTGNDTNLVEGFYYWVDRGILYDIQLDYWDDILSMFNISQKNINFLKKENENMNLDYIGFDLYNNIQKTAFATNKEWFFYRDPYSQFSEYIKINPVLDLLADFFDDDDLWISLQFSPSNQSFFAIEFSLHPSRIKDFSEKMFEYAIIDETEYFNFINMNIPKEYQVSIIKFRWNNEEEFCVKFYLEEFLDTPSRDF